MDKFRYRWKNFRSFDDTDWVPSRSLNIVIGPNNSGKSSLLTPLLLLKQTWNSPDPGIALNLNGAMVHAGSYRDVVCDHEVDRTIEFGIDFVEPSADESPVPALGLLPPSVIEMQFRQSELAPRFPVLSSFRSLDGRRRVLMTRRLGKNGYTLANFRKTVDSILAHEDLELDNTPLSDKATDRFVKDDLPMNFVFTGSDVLQRFYSSRMYHDDEDAEQTGPTRSAPSLANLSAYAQLYVSTTQFQSHLFADHLLSNMTYVGPLRRKAERSYEVMQEIPSDVGHSGERTAELLFHHQDDAVTESLDRWMERFGFAGKLRCQVINDSLFSLNLCRDGGSATNIADTGFGLSQVLPLVVSGLTARRGALIVAEQPEIHLNPRLQGVLADLFVDLAKNNTSLLVETHSEHLLMRLRWLVAEGEIDPNDVALLYVEKAANRSTVREVGLDANGSIAPDDWPKGFFEDSMRYALGLASAQATRASQD